jgi:hypothetical protein
LTIFGEKNHNIGPSARKGSYLGGGKKIRRFCEKLSAKAILHSENPK